MTLVVHMPFFAIGILLGYCLSTTQGFIVETTIGRRGRRPLIGASQSESVRNHLALYLLRRCDHHVNKRRQRSTLLIPSGGNKHNYKDTNLLQLSRSNSDSFAYPFSATTSRSTNAGTNTDRNIDDAGNEFLLFEKIDALLRAKVPNLESVQKDIMQKINQSYNADIEFCSSFASEERLQPQHDKNNNKMQQYENIYEMRLENHNQNHDNVVSPQSTTSSSILAIRTIDNPIIDQSSVETIRNAAESYWFDDKRDKGSGKSRFTIQRKGNYEAHLVDLARLEQQNTKQHNKNPQEGDDDGNNNESEPEYELRKERERSIFTIMNDTLRNRIYPMVRDAFYDDIPDIDDIEFCVYDSLVIRYNSTEAAMAMNSDTPFIGANQPLHRDLGLVSVNIMLNSGKDFEGGGTFFENQMISKLNHQNLKGNIATKNTQNRSANETLMPLKPKVVGQALAHLSSKRHAGAGTTFGVRDILVLFLTAKKKAILSKGTLEAPTMEKAARLKLKAREYSQECSQNKEESILHRIISHRLAVDNVPCDGEAWHYLGMALRDYVSNVDLSQNEKWETMQLSINCLKHALELTPCDGRLCNNLALAHETLFQLTANEKSNSEIQDDLVYHSSKQQQQITAFYEQSELLHSIAQGAGCDVKFDADQACLNHGLYLSKQDRFADAERTLSRFSDNNEVTMDAACDPNHLRIVYDGSRLLHFCRTQSHNCPKEEA